MKAVCDWCLTNVKAPSHYQPLQQAIYCSTHCAQKDHLFKLWQNDRFLNHVAKEYGNENTNKKPTGKA